MAHLCRRAGWFLAACSVCAAGVAAQPVVWEADQGGNSHAYEFVPTDGIHWAEARAAAEARTYGGQAGYLATITSAAENAFATALVNSPGIQEAWLGGQQLDPADPPDVGWSWITGEAWSYTNWTPGEPNDDPGHDWEEHFLGMWGVERDLGGWNDETDLPGSPTGVSGYLVEYSACYPDFDGDGELSLFDFLAYVNAFNAEDPASDCDGDGEFLLFDFLCFVNAFNEGC